MKNKILLILLAVVLAISLGVVGCAGGEQEEEEEEEEPIELIFSDFNPPESPGGRALTAYANYIADHSDWKVEIAKIGYSGEILALGEEFAGLQAGVADCVSYTPDIDDGLEYIQVLTMPFMGWPSQQAATAIFQDLVEDYDEILGQFPSTLTFETLYMSAPLQLHYRYEDWTPEFFDDIAGLDIICMEGYISQPLDMLGARTVVSPYPDVIDMVEGYDSFFALSTEFCAVFNLLESLHGHTFFEGGIVMTPIVVLWNTESYNAVVEAVGEWVMDEARAVYIETWYLWSAVETACGYMYLTEHADEHRIVWLDAAEIEPCGWVEATQPYVTAWENACDDPALAAEIYDAAKAYIANYAGYRPYCYYCYLS